jgi:hypothetical protein
MPMVNKKLINKINALKFARRAVANRAAAAAGAFATAAGLPLWFLSPPQDKFRASTTGGPPC